MIVAEPKALLSFTGPRVVQQTTREKLPDDFGLSESNYRYGHVDAILPSGASPVPRDGCCDCSRASLRDD